MDPKLFPAFIDEAMRQVPVIRGVLLLYLQSGPEAADPEPTLRILSSITDSAGFLGLVEIGDLARAIADEISAYRTSPAEVRQARINSSLDILSNLEATLLKASLDDENFSLDIDDFIDVSFEVFNEHPRSDAAGRPTAELSEDLLFEAETAFAADDTKLSREPQTFESSGGDDEFDVDPELLEIFAEEAEGLLRNIETSLEKLAEEPNDREALWEIRRNAHTFKGSAGIVGLKQLSELAHRVEDLLDRLVETKNASNERIFELLHTSTNCLKALTAGDTSAELFHSISQLYYDFDGVVASLNEAAAEAPEEAVPQPVFAEAIGPETPVEEANILSEKIFEIVSSEPASSRPASKAVVRVSLNRLDDLVRIVRDMFMSRSVFEQSLRSLERQADDLHNATRRLQSISTKLEIDFESSVLSSGNSVLNQSGFASLGRSETFDELELDRYTDFHQSARELAETASDSFSINSSLEIIRSSFESVLEDQRRLIDELQEKLMRIRMVEFGSLTTRLQRAVRVTCEEENKKAQIRIENEHLEIDTQILDSLIEPLTHLLKNAVVHGIEDPDTRRLLGKPEIGMIDVAVENDETHIVLTIADDGRGISVSALKEKAIAMGHLSDDAAASLTEEEALELIFLPGLTTAERLNLSAGRGVGMSIVRESVGGGRGTISIDSDYQKGTKFTIRMPLALAVTNVVVVRVGTRSYALPHKPITYITELTDDMFVGIDGRKVEVFGKKLPLLQISEFLGYEPVPPAELLGKAALLYETDERSCVIAVEEVTGSEEVVIKPLLKPLEKINGIFGAALVGGGELVPILDMPALFRSKVERKPKPASPSAPNAPRTIDVLIVDDSPSVRHLTSKVVQAAGWNARTAKDGLDALEQLKAAEHLPVAILSDIEMPRMDGYELAASLQSSEHFSSIPVIMITSRTADKHRDRALENGVSHYLTKPYEDKDLIESIRRLAGLT